MNDTSDKALRSRKDAANPVAEKLRDHAKYGRFGEYNDVALSGAEEIERLHDLNGSLQRELSRACQETREALSREVAALRSAPETRALQEFVKGLSRQHCSHGGDKNAPAWPCIPCAARTVLGDENTLKAAKAPVSLAEQIADAQQRIAEWPDDVRIAMGLKISDKPK
jgi:FtsZ-binding cell division protein ZapB